jgi:hypothetical protein
VPKQCSTGGNAKLSGISKRGNCYLRKILIHGARAVVLRSKRERIAMGGWMTTLEARAPRNVLIVATANKLARIAWAVLSSGRDYADHTLSMCIAGNNKRQNDFGRSRISRHACGSSDETAINRLTESRAGRSTAS